MFPKIGVFPPKWMVKIMENPIKMDDLGVPLFLETPIYTSSLDEFKHDLSFIDSHSLEFFAVDFSCFCLLLLRESPPSFLRGF